MEIICVIIQVYLLNSVSKTSNLSLIDSVAYKQPHERDIYVGIDKLCGCSTNVLFFTKSICACDPYNN